MNALNNVKYYFKSRAQKALVRFKKKNPGIIQQIKQIQAQQMVDLGHVLCV